ncbi:MAG: PBP1A family penicillin-binding protein [Treponema sp.]|jgi:penicillin-binding protein 1A|nr:PBP1A family penicillin-binding protein [Treponema sp.]
MGRYSGRGIISIIFVRLVIAFTIIIVVFVGIGLGLSLAMTANIRNQENFVEFAPALPTRLLDINGTLITEFASDEKRELVSISELPRHLIHAVLAREDPDFYNHKGFSLRGIARAAWGQLSGKSLGGGSTITQQVAGTLYTNRSERTIRRKVRELWWAFQIERRYSKDEILEIYLNYMPMGPGTYGVETASRYFFGHSARDVSIAEAAVLAVLLSGPNRFDPLRNPNLAMDRQHFVLERMVYFGYADKDEAEASYAEYWENFDWTRPSLSAYLTREDRAPWFSEYVRRELDSLMYGTMDYYRDGYVVHTTLNLAHQEAAERIMAQGLERANREYAATSRRGNFSAERRIMPIVDLLTLAFDITDIRNIAFTQNEARAASRYSGVINPIVDLAALAFDIPELKDITSHGFDRMRERTQQTVVEGALVSIENETGYIVAIVGGSRFDESNQLIRASQANVQTGSAIKPLYYSAALDTRRFTAASMIYDEPVVFFNDDNTLYVPTNYAGRWRGSILMFDALSLSLNIPSITIMESIGFDASINRSATLLGYTDEGTIRRLFPRVYPLALGVTSTSPLRMARAFAIFGNEGRDVTPIAIRTIEDRNGRVVFDVERDVRQRQQRAGARNQVVSPQNAFIMTRMMEFAGTSGTLTGGTGGGRFIFRNEDGTTFRMPVAGKTGTTQNWTDAWTIGYTPYYTTAVWFGFDRLGNSLGISQTGAALAAPVWGDMMRELHIGLPQRNWVRPSGIVDVTVCRKSGRLRNAHCNEGAVTLPFMVGTAPGTVCTIHGDSTFRPIPVASSMFGVDDALLGALSPLPPLPDIFSDFQIIPPRSSQDNQRTDPNPRIETRTPMLNNPFLDDDIDTTPSDIIPVNEPDNTESSLPDRLPESIPAIIPETTRFVTQDENEDNLPSWNPLD